VTDCARISLEFATAEGLERAATFRYTPHHTGGQTFDRAILKV
jgi:hypothetical protein